jgi:acetylornithine deacetylase/succinyl-diaminopimelate desuccinylase-like protein
MDVVRAGDRDKWRFDPFSATVADGSVWGRGVADSKGMLAGMMAAVRAIIESGEQPSGDLFLCAYVDDETAGPMGLRHVFNEGYITTDNLILGEATTFEIQYVFKSRIWFDIEVVGKASHGAFPDRGVNAIDKAMSIIRAIRSIDMGTHPALGSGTINVGKIEGGEQVNVVPRTCRVSFDLRWGPPMRSDEIRRRVDDALARAKEGDPLLETGELEVTELREPIEFRTDSPLVQAIKAAGRTVLDREVGLGGWYSSGELWPVASAGHIKYGAVLGPGEPWQAHAYDEHVPVRELVDAAKMYALSAFNICFRS